MTAAGAQYWSSTNPLEGELISVCDEWGVIVKVGPSYASGWLSAGRYVERTTCTSIGRTVLDMAPARRDLSDTEQERLQELREESASAMADHLTAGPGPDDPLGRLAWKAGTTVQTEYPFDEDLRQRVNLAKDARFSWREISAALGEGDDPASARRVREKQEWRNHAFDESTRGSRR